MFSKNTLPDQPRPAVFYGIPKIHKLPEVMKTAMECRNIIDENLSDQATIHIVTERNILPPFGPIISGIGCFTENMSAYVDKILQRFLPNIPSCIQDTTRFLNCISKIRSVLHNALIVSMVVKALYNSIPHSDCIKACEIFIVENGFPSMEISNITIIIDYILKHGNSEFNNESYIQTHGTAMGTQIAPTYANIFFFKLKNVNWIIAQTNLFYIYVISMTFFYMATR